MATVDELVVRIEADMSDLKRKLKQSTDAVDKSVGKQKKSFLTLGRTIKGVVAGVVAIQVARFGQHMVKMASAVEEMQAKSSVVFGEFTGTVRAELEQFGDAVGRSTFELEGMASQVQDTFVPLGFARGDAAKLSVQLTKLAVDVASFNNATDVDTMRAFQSALVGNHETVRRFGIVITEAELQQELFRMGINKSKDEVTAQEKVQARLNLILAGTTDAHNDAARTADSFANRSKALGGALEELGVGVITPLLDDLAVLVGGLVDATNAVKEFLLNAGLIQRDISTQIARTKEITRLREIELDLVRRIGEERKRNTGQLKRELGAIREQIKVIQGIDFNEDLKKRLRRQGVLPPPVEDDVDIALPKKRPVKNPEFEQMLFEHNEELRENREHADKLLEILKKSNEKRREEQKRSKDFRIEDLKERMDAEREQMEIVRQLIGEEENFSTQIHALNSALEQGKITIDEYNKGMANLKEEMFATTENGKMALQAVDGLSQGFASTLVTAMETGKISLRSLGSVVKDVMAQMAQDFLKAQIRAMLLKVAMSALGMGAPSPSMFVGGGKLSGVGGAAGGGRVQAKRPVMVGERGPELFVPNTGGVVKNNMDTKNMMGSGKTVVVNQYLNFATGVSQTVRAEVLGLMPLIKDQTLNAVIDQKQRGGAFAQALS